MISAESECDIYLYLGGIYREGYNQLTDIIEENKKQNQLSKKVVFILSTFGGDPHSGYRIGRALQHYYPDNVNVLIPSYCKSAGTLVTISANTLIISNKGELGPLDIQLQKEDEIGASNSGLDIFKAITHLQERAISMFNDYVNEIRYKTRISTRLSAEIAKKLTDSLISPIANQIEPMKVGEHQRALEMSLEYGVRLAEKSKNLKTQDVLARLTMGYPDHGFVIDRCEAYKLFNNVISDSENPFLSKLNVVVENYLKKTDISGKPSVFLLPEEVKIDLMELTQNDKSKPITKISDEQQH